jgi:hypothetical protein
LYRREILTKDGNIMDIKDGFYLGRVFDPKTGKTTDQPYLYDANDLTTHAVVVGMTGSGKTGLCVDLLEEAALNGIPALMIDPKGDITNLLLHFPELTPQDFQPWINQDQARREGKTVEQAAAETAALWKKGLSDWGIDSERLKALKDAAQFTVYTPGSDAGVSVSILASLKAPDLSWEGNREVLREKISSTVTALLGLVGLVDIDPVRSREHILLSNIFENAWQKGTDLDLGELIMQTQSPPFAKLGVFEVDRFFPEKDRFELAMLLNNILAAPAFQTWIEGQPLDIPELLFTPDGKPRHSVFYIAHLTDSERMFFVTLLYSAVEAWMHAQAGTTALRALVYFDEIFGYMPPVKNPPSKEPMLRMLKQARAFGVGQVLVTQNPVDLDYKALSNAGTWFIGKLQTEKDKERLLDGLESALAGGLDRQAYDRLISAIGKRVFLVNNVNEKGPQLMQTRWAMNYLAGPLTRTQIPALNELMGGEVAPPASKPAAGAAPAAAAVAAAAAKPQVPKGTPQEGMPQRDAAKGTVTRPPIPSGVAEYFLPVNLSFTEAFGTAGRAYPSDAMSQGILYRPVLAAQADVRFLNRTYDLDFEQRQAVRVADADPRGRVRWDEYLAPALDQKSFERQAYPDARFASIEAPFNDARLMDELQRDFTDWAYRTVKVSVRANETLKVYAGPQTSQADFRKMCAEAAREKRDADIAKVQDTYERKIETLNSRLGKEHRELEQDEAELKERGLEEWGTHAENLLGLLGGRKRRLTTSLSKRRMTAASKAEVKESQETIADINKQINDLKAEEARALEAVNQKWSEIVDDMKEIPFTPNKKDVLVDLFGVAWMPYYLARVGNEVIELPGFGEE